ncbi:MAG: dihydropteroate synthase [Armatimonadetes bacterium]|nr:dihydropteroate synthase [Armatimonadota bacterium]
MSVLPIGRPALMGVLNVTPDSFSDGGLYFDQDKAVEAGIRMVEDGADLVDVGGESTRPGASPVSAEDERQRVVPVVRRLVERGVVVSVDTSKVEVASAALDAGAQVVNDVTAFGDPEMADVCARSGCTVCLMHMQGEPRTMQEAPHYDDVVAEVRDFLVGRARAAEAVGVAGDRIWIDPGIGFGKTLGHNLALLARLDEFVATGYPVLIGVSRKSFLGKILGGAPPDERLEGTLAVQVLAQAAGAKIVRAHDVRPARRAMEVASAVLSAGA